MLKPDSTARADYPDEELPEERKWVITKLTDGEIDLVERPSYFWGDLKENYEAPHDAAGTLET